MLIIGFGLLIAVRTTGGILRLITAGKEVEMAQTELNSTEAENEKLKQRLTEVNSPEFVIKEAKKKLGMGISGDTIVLAPEVEEPSYFAEATKDVSNWRKWWKLYIRI
ncbi:MAG: septum formation initiator family protein [Patescibacteria group bacterium]